MCRDGIQIKPFQIEGVVMISYSRSLSKTLIGLAVSSFAILFLLASAGLADEYKANFSYTESTAGLDRVFLETINGDITFAGTEGETVQIETQMEIEGESDAIEEYKKEFKTEITRSDDGRLTIKTVRPKHEEKFEDTIERSSISYAITLPPEFDIKVETVNANITATAVHGDLYLDTVNGNIKYKNDKPVSGEIQVETINGEANIDIAALMNDCSIESVNGELDIRISENMKGKISAETVNGSITLTVPESASFSLEADAAMNGDIETDWGDGKNEQTSPGGTFEKEINGGGNKVDLETVNGSIEVHAIK
jgi:DUF4097 and DUF4098 domain-containing protein YvlB